MLQCHSHSQPRIGVWCIFALYIGFKSQKANLINWKWNEDGEEELVVVCQSTEYELQNKEERLWKEIKSEDRFVWIVTQRKDWNVVQLEVSKVHDVDEEGKSKALFDLN